MTREERLFPNDFAAFPSFLSWSTKAKQLRDLVQMKWATISKRRRKSLDNGKK